MFLNIVTEMLVSRVIMLFTCVIIVIPSIPARPENGRIILPGEFVRVNLQVKFDFITVSALSTWLRTLESLAKHLLEL